MIETPRPAETMPRTASIDSISNLARVPGDSLCRKLAATRPLVREVSNCSQS